MKYIVTINSSGYEEIFTFPRSIEHKKIMQLIEFIDDRKPVSAGFVYSDNHCYGRSETLSLDSRPELDSDLLEDQLSELGL